MRGTHCQICGGLVKANTGVIAHHGYRRPGYGWQTESCPGARFAPYEVSRDRIPEVIREREVSLARSEASLADLIATPPAELTIELGGNARGYGARTITVVRPEGFQWGRPVSIQAQRTYEYEAARRRIQLERDIIPGFRDSIEFLNKRFARWTASKDRS